MDFLNKRYSRQTALEGFGKEGQERLANSVVLLVGLGGVGSAVLPLLTGAGVGRIEIFDFDKVSESNLARQTIYSESEIGFSKSELAAKKFAKQNSGVQIISHNTKLEKIEDLTEFLQNADICIDASDSFTTRFLVSDACKICEKNLITASAEGWVAQTLLLGQNFYLKDFLPNFCEIKKDSEAKAIFNAAAHLSGVWAAGFALRFLLSNNFDAGFFQRFCFENAKYFKANF